jgi:hypothetical protein
MIRLSQAVSQDRKGRLDLAYVLFISKQTANSNRITASRHNTGMNYRTGIVRLPFVPLILNRIMMNTE